MTEEKSDTLLVEFAAGGRLMRGELIVQVLDQYIREASTLSARLGLGHDAAVRGKFIGDYLHAASILEDSYSREVFFARREARRDGAV